jgi:hypothetical protein
VVPETTARFFHQDDSRTALNIAIGSAGRLASLLPDNRFADHRINASRRAAVFSPVRGRMLVTAFRSPATLLLSEPPFRGQRSWPATSLPTRRFLCPFGLSAPLPSPVSPGLGRFIASGPLQFPRLARRHRLQPPLPLGTFMSRRIKAFCWISCLSARLPAPPDFPSLPAAGFYLPGSIASSYY